MNSRIAVSIRILMFLMVNLIACAGYAQMSWMNAKNWEQVKKRAQAEGKFIFVDCMATWCGPCKKMEEEVYPQPAISSLFNSCYICVKLQLDSTSRDSKEVQQWYAAARSMREKYRVRAYPTYLFFTPQGELVFREAGAKKEQDFLTILRTAVDSGKVFGNQLTAWRAGKRDYAITPSLILKAEGVGDNALAASIARDCIRNYMAKAAKANNLNADLVRAVGPYYEPNDKKELMLFYPKDNGDRTDKLINSPGTSAAIMNVVIEKDINDRLVKAGDYRRPIIKNPNWERIYGALIQMYDAVDVERLLDAIKVKWYLMSEPDWNKVAKLHIEQIKEDYYNKGTIQPGPINDRLWKVFLNVNDTALLLEAASLQLLAVQEAEKTADRFLSGYADTYAGLLYKAGKKQEAIPWQEKAIQYRQQFEAKRGDKTPNLMFITRLEQMKRGEPTWIGVR